MEKENVVLDVGTKRITDVIVLFIQRLENLVLLEEQEQADKLKPLIEMLIHIEWFYPNSTVSISVGLGGITYYLNLDFLNLPGKTVELFKIDINK